MFRVPRLTLTPPTPDYLGWLGWKHLVNLDVEGDDTAAAVVVNEDVVASGMQSQRDIDMWTARLSDFNDPFTLAGCLWRINDAGENPWLKYFRSSSKGQPFVWWFDNVKYNSNNPYFELLFRCLRKVCTQLNGCDERKEESGPSTTDTAASTLKVEECKVCIQEALKRMDPSRHCQVIDAPGSITEKPGYHRSCAVPSCPWRDHNFFTALFSMSTIKKAVYAIHDDAAELVRLAEESVEEEDARQISELFLRIHFNITHLNDLTVLEKSNPSNPFSVYLPFVSYMEEVQRFLAAVGTACNALLTKDIAGYENTVTFHVDDFQPSLLRLLKTKGFALTSATASGRCHESDRPQPPVQFTIFANDKINRNREDYTRQIELHNVLARYSSLPQMKRTIPRLKCIDVDVSEPSEPPTTVFSVAKVLDAVKRFCDWDLDSSS